MSNFTQYKLFIGGGKTNTLFGVTFSFKDILHLVEILLVLPISAAGCERMVSSQNRIKSSLRASLKTTSLEGLIRISAQGPRLEEFDPVPSVKRWFARDRSKGERQ